MAGKLKWLWNASPTNENVLEYVDSPADGVEAAETIVQDFLDDHEYLPEVDYGITITYPPKFAGTYDIQVDMEPIVTAKQI